MSLQLSGFEGMPGSEWQQLCVRVLHEHHGPGQLIEIPDHDRGDGGIEAFSLSGLAYQCYSPEGEPLDSADRLRKQRKKLRKSVNDFIGRKTTLAGMIPRGLRVNRYVLLVPLISSKALISLAAELTEDLREANLPYASDDICVVPLTLNAYEGARQAVIARQLSRLELPPLDELDYSGLTDPQIEKMHEKLGKTRFYRTQDKRDRFVDRLLENFVSAEAYREFVFDQYPELAEELSESLNNLEKRLDVQYPLQHPNPDGLLSEVLKDTERTVSRVLNTRDAQSLVMAEGQVADWLMRCPLDFTAEGS